MATIYRSWAFLPLSSVLGRRDDESVLILLAQVLVSVVALVLLVLFGWLVDQLLK